MAARAALRGQPARARARPSRELDRGARRTSRRATRRAVRGGVAAPSLCAAQRVAAGQGALDLARATSAAGFTPEVAGLRHGFLIERWIDDARPLRPRAFGHERLLAHLARYLALRATRTATAGASCSELIAMVRRNVTLGVGGEV